MPPLTTMRNLRKIPKGIHAERIPRGINNRCRWGGELNQLNSNNVELEGYSNGGLQPGASYNFSQDRGRENFQQRRVQNIGGLSPDETQFFPGMVAKNNEYFQERSDRKTTNFLLFLIAGLLTYKLFISEDRRSF